MARHDSKLVARPPPARHGGRRHVHHRTRDDLVAFEEDLGKAAEAAALTEALVAAP
jgi:hypothetical protein